MADEVLEKRGPIEKTKKGWPINPLGVVALLVFIAIFVFFIARPFITQKLGNKSSVTGQLISPASGQIVREDTLPIELSVDNPSKVQRVEFWAKSYADGKWEMIGKDEEAPFRVEWQIPSTYRNKAVAITSHLYDKEGKDIADPGGWREGIIILD